MSLIRAAVVGVGYLGSFHAQKYKSLNQQGKSVELVGVYDQNFDQAKSVAEKNTVKAFSQISDLYSQIDAVTIATVTPSHYQLAKDFLSNGIHVNVEKPICLDVNQAKELVELAKKNNVVLCVGHSERFSPVFQEVKKQAQKAKYIELVRRAPFNKRGSDVSVVHDLMIHDLDLVLSVDSSQVRLVEAQGAKFVTSSWDWASAVLQFASGLKAIVHCSRINFEMQRSIRWIDNNQEIFGDFQQGYVRTSRVHSDSEIKHTQVETGKGDNLLSETENFIAAIRGETKPAVPGEDGLRALQLAEEISSYLYSRGF